MPDKFNKYITPTDWIHIKFNSYEYSMMKHRKEAHKLFKREFINAFLAEQKRRKDDEAGTDNKASCD